MMFAYAKKYFKGNGEDSNLFQLVLKQAMDHVNATSGMELSFNYSFTAHNTIESYSKWIDVDDGAVSLLQNSNTIICISDDESDVIDDPNQLVDIRRNNCTDIQFVSNKMQLSDLSNLLFFQTIVFFSCFGDTNIFSISISNDKDSAKCPLCCKIVDRKALNFHFNDCDLFCI